jgi:hypothetical protein
MHVRVATRAIDEYGKRTRSLCTSAGDASITVPRDRLKLRRDGKVLATAVYVILGIDGEGQHDVLGHWVGDGGEGANFWLSVVTDLQARGVEDVFLACVDGLNGFKAAIQAVFLHTRKSSAALFTKSDTACNT